MGAIITLSTIGVVTAFLIRILSGFPFEGVTTTVDPNDEGYSVESVEEVGSLFTGNYMALIDEIVAYQTNPDYDKAEARLQDMTSLASTMQGDLQQFGDRMKGDLDVLTAVYEQIATSTDPTIP